MKNEGFYFEFLSSQKFKKVPLNYHKIQDVSFGPDDPIMKVTSSDFYKTDRFVCIDFYKNISSILKKNGI